MSFNISRIFKKKAKEQLIGEFSGNFDFYGDKSVDLPRLIYRRLMVKLGAGADSSQRAKAIAAFTKEIENRNSLSRGAKSDFLKMKWCLPDYLRAELSPAELADVENFLQARRGKRNRKLLDVYPHSSDEFSLDDNFIDSVFAQNNIGLFNSMSKIFTIGSCFARNIATFLTSQNYKNVIPFVQVEDLNSPLSNAKMLQVAIAPEAEKNAYLEKWIRKFSPSLNDKGIEQAVQDESMRLAELVKSLGSAEILIITIGNTLDFFIEDAADKIGAEIPVAPKFLAVMNNENVEFRTSVASELKKAGAVFRMASFAEAKASINALYRAIRKINPAAPCIITLSPVPIDSAVGIETKLPYGAIEMDTISKSTLRAALFELFNEWSEEEKNTYYFPSFEIVRWIGGNLRETPIFGNEDASSRHVSAAILEAVYKTFLRKFQLNEDQLAEAL